MITNRVKNLKNIIKIIAGTILSILANALFIASDWLKTHFANTSFAEIIFHLKVPLSGTNLTAFSDVVRNCLLYAPLLSLLGLILAINSDSEHRLILRIVNKRFFIPLNIWEMFYPFFTFGLLIIALFVSMIRLEVPDYIQSNLNSSTIYEDYYVDPKTAKITFPKEKRNLIYIFMESMENSYMSIEDGGAKEQNLIPEMRDLMLSNTCFSASGKINGGLVPQKTSWTMSAIVSQTAGIPLSIPIHGNRMNEYSSFLPGAYSIGEILDKQGYQQLFLIGSDATFGGRANYMKYHGNYAIEDYYHAIDRGWIEPDYQVFWGYEDKKLYNNAKKELVRLSEDNKPFNLTMLTVDTHFIGGYICDLCTYNILDQNSNFDQYSNVIACASRQIADFISWIQKQSFYENTTIVIVGDHLTMDTDYMNNKPDNYQRKVYATIINSANEYKLDYDREYTTLDMYPTTLASLGAVIKGNRLGLGTNLFSDTSTLVEEMGIDELNAQLDRNSKYYNKKILYD